MNLTIYTFKGTDIAQHPEDGYMNATAMCQANGKLFADYQRLKTTQKFLQELSSVMGIPITDLIRSVQGGDAKLQGTWVHPLVANNLGQWCSPPFAVFVAVLLDAWRKAGQPDFRKPPTQHPSSYSDRVHLEADLLIAKGLKPDKAFAQAIRLVKDATLDEKRAAKALLADLPIRAKALLDVLRRGGLLTFNDITQWEGFPVVETRFDLIELEKRGLIECFMDDEGDTYYRASQTEGATSDQRLQLDRAKLEESAG